MTFSPEDMNFSGEIDLHHFAPEDTEFLVKALIDEALREGRRQIRIVHGKGRSAKKRRIRAVLESDGRIISYADDGTNWGATVAEIRIMDYEG
jgi:DNA-nicking Smr family endonuclease